MLRFGTAGIPICLQDKERTTELGIAKLKSLGLDAMELEFVQSVNISEAKSPSVKRAAQDNDILLTAHGQYFINLNAKEQEKVQASIERIKKAARILHLCGGYSLTFHAAFYLKDPKDITYQNVHKNLKSISESLRQEGIRIWLRPETTGKATQWGDLDEITRMAQEIEGVLPCVDFSHLHARSAGKENTKKEFDASLSLIESRLGRQALDNMHIHLSGINYGDKGEKNHLMLRESDMNYQSLLESFKDFKIGGVVICESPVMEDDALLLKKAFIR